MSAARPETGATAERLTVMTNLAINTYRESFTISGDGSHVGAMRDAVAAVLIAVVPEGSVIALAEHVTDAADREAIGRALTLLRAVDKFATANSWDDIDDAVLDEFAEAARQAREEFTPDDLARLERLGSGGEESK